jgi:cytochrome c2
MKPTHLYFLLIVLIISGCKPTPSTPKEEKQGSSTPVISNLFEEISLAAVIGEGAVNHENIHLPSDPVVKKENIEVKGYDLKQILNRVYGQSLLDSLKNDYAVEFICTDGYNPRINLNLILENKGYIVNKIINEGKEEALIPKHQPYYLVWENIQDVNILPWPYALANMRLINLADEKEFLLPVEDAVAANGLQVYKKYCMKCHAINGIGGIMGPELNYPRNIIQYFQQDSLYAYVKDPQAFRHNNRMAPVKNITKADMEAIIHYFEYIQQYPKLNNG